MKVVINGRFGGFHPSEPVLTRYSQRRQAKGKDKITSPYDVTERADKDLVEVVEELAEEAFTRYNQKRLAKGEDSLGQDDLFDLIWRVERYGPSSIHKEEFDEDSVTLEKEFAETVGDLRIEEVPDEYVECDAWRIDEYDGAERIELFEDKLEFYKEIKRLTQELTEVKLQNEQLLQELKALKK